MPVSVGRCGEKWCVKDPDGTVVPGGEHDTEQDAIDHATAINANTEKEAMGDVINTTGTLTVKANKTKKLEFPELEPDLKEAIKEKGLEEAMMYGPESFDDLDALREYTEKTHAITKIVNDFMALLGNVFSWPGPGKAKKVKELAKEMIERLPEDEEDFVEEEDEEEEMKEVDNIDDSPQQGFWIWKQVDGTYRWLGVYSNKYRDEDRPAEILAEKAHVDFIERVEKGELPYPDLYVWHLKSPIGKADTLAFDDTGFSIASGTIDEDFALALMNTSEDLAMSHGMPSDFIQRSKEDPTVITSYVSTEVSVLPRSAAANKRTDFRILKEEATMAIVPAEKRQQIVGLLGEDLTAKLEADLDSKAKEANELGVEYKEETAETEAVTEVVEPTTETTEELVEPDADAGTEPQNSEEKEETSESAEGAEDVSDVTPDEGVTAAADGEAQYVNKGELAETLAALMNGVTSSNEALMQAVKGLNERIDALESGLEEEQASKQASEQAKLAASTTPTASLWEMFTKQLAEPARSVIGTKEAKVHGNDKLKNAKPKETDYDEENPQPDDGLFWHRW